MPHQKPPLLPASNDYLDVYDLLGPGGSVGSIGQGKVPAREGDPQQEEQLTNWMKLQLKGMREMTVTLYHSSKDVRERVMCVLGEHITILRRLLLHQQGDHLVIIPAHAKEQREEGDSQVPFEVHFNHRRLGEEEPTNIHERAFVSALQRAVEGSMEATERPKEAAAI